MELYRKAAKLGFTSMRIPEEYGGQGYGVLEECIVVEEMCRVDPGLGAAISLGNLMIPDILLKHGTEEQKEKYIPRLAKGEAISAAAFTEPEHGSDITKLDTTAVKEGNEWVINGTKTFITNAPITDYFIYIVSNRLKRAAPQQGTKHILGRKGNARPRGNKASWKNGNKTMHNRLSLHG